MLFTVVIEYGESVCVRGGGALCDVLIMSQSLGSTVSLSFSDVTFIGFSVTHERLEFSSSLFRPPS